MFYKKLIFVLSLIAIAFLSQALASNGNKGDKMNSNIENVIVKDIDGKEVKLSEYKGKVLLIVNFAS